MNKIGKLKEGALLTQEEIEELLPQLDYIEKWAKNLKDYCLNEALAGRKFKGYKLVEGRSSKTISDQQAVVNKVTEAGYDEVMCYKPKELLSASEFEKLLGKKLYRELVEPYVSKTPGKATLVDESDKRPELGVSSAINDFKDDIDQ